MTVQAWTFTLVGLSFALYIGIAVWSRAHSTKEFYVAGAGVSPLANGMATAADWMSAASFISMAGIISFTGSLFSYFTQSSRTKGNLELMTFSPRCRMSSWT